VFPAPDDPSVFLSAWEGDLGLDDGATQSIYTLKTDRMTQLGLQALRPGERWDLPDGAGVIEFTGFTRWASFQIAHDPGKEGALAGAVLAMIGLMATALVQRRRVWVRVASDASGSTVEVAGLARHEWEGLHDEVGRIAASIERGSP
jgi:cytochrome c biogenesis protein